MAFVDYDDLSLAEGESDIGRRRRRVKRTRQITRRTINTAIPVMNASS